VCFSCWRHEEFKDFFSQKDGAMFSMMFIPLWKALGHEYIPDQWRLFIDT
jgi:hypothetical protein